MASTDKLVPGQRWVSDTEPELGLGIVLKVEFGRVDLLFPAASERRQYAPKSAPIRRVRFKAGDAIESHEGESFVVDAVEEREGLLVYQCGERDLPEAELLDSISFSKPDDRLIGGQVGDLRTFDLRTEALYRLSEMRQSPLRGFIGGRIDLIPHQMGIAGEVTERLLPRVLLADEVGLGKTIEACLVLHRLHLTGRAERVLVLVPEPLVHQWFVELFRRFNLRFSIFDEERCASLEAGDPEGNPFLDSQLVLCGVDFLSSAPQRAEQVAATEWDLLIVDEAHHLEWSPEAASASYRLVESLARRCPGVLLLTATPQQLGRSGHFARLRLLDPDRYTDLDAYLEESRYYETVADAVERLLGGKSLRAKERQLFGAKSARIRRHAELLEAGDESARAALVSELVDEFGTGRVMFRNSRAALSGFPERRALLAPIEAGSNGDTDADGDEEELLIAWLAGLLRELGEEKVLLICRTREKAEAVSEGLRERLNVDLALFHEDLTLLQRDRNAAFFAEPDGARVLVCSEIGSEGRNFQFAHHLVLFDLPDNPEVLEQRIGRLDRIGQTATIQIHVPYVRGTEGEVLASWYHEGLNAFEKSLHGAAEILRELRDELAALRAAPQGKALRAFIERTRECRARVAQKLERGHDRLLQLNAAKPEDTGKILRGIKAADNDFEWEEFLLRLFDHFGLDVEDLEDRGYLLRPGNLITDALPELPEEGLSMTFDRARALAREDIAFMSRDHPIVRGALDIMLGAEHGNTAFGVWESEEKEALLVEAYVVIECVAPAALHVDRFLPATPLRVVVDHALTDFSEDEELREAAIVQGDARRVLDKAPVRQDMLPRMFEKVQALAKERMGEIVRDAMTLMETQLLAEIGRLEDLRAINDHVRPEEIEAMKAQRDELREVMEAARPRLDAVRLIWRVSGRKRSKS